MSYRGTWDFANFRPDNTTWVPGDNTTAAIRPLGSTAMFGPASTAMTSDGRVGHIYTWRDGSTSNFELRLGYASSLASFLTTSSSITHDRALMSTTESLAPMGTLTSIDGVWWLCVGWCPTGLGGGGNNEALFDSSVDESEAADIGTNPVASLVALWKSTDDGDNWTLVRELGGIDDLWLDPTGSTTYDLYAFGLIDYLSVDSAPHPPTQIFVASNGTWHMGVPATTRNTDDHMGAGTSTVEVVRAMVKSNDDGANWQLETWQFDDGVNPEERFAIARGNARTTGNRNLFEVNGTVSMFMDLNSSSYGHELMYQVSGVWNGGMADAGVSTSGDGRRPAFVAGNDIYSYTDFLTPGRGPKVVTDIGSVYPSYFSGAANSAAEEALWTELVDHDGASINLGSVSSPDKYLWQRLQYGSVDVAVLHIQQSIIHVNLYPWGWQWHFIN